MYCTSSTFPHSYSCPMFTLVSKHIFLFVVSPTVRQPCYIKTHLTVITHLLTKTYYKSKYWDKFILSHSAVKCCLDYTDLRKWICFHLSEAPRFIAPHRRSLPDSCSRREHFAALRATSAPTSPPPAGDKEGTMAPQVKTVISRFYLFLVPPPPKCTHAHAYTNAHWRMVDSSLLSHS